ncbi:glycosyl transferase family 1 [Bifidobacterium actinocoloniiforme DSM 22766]|uniref:Glycosyl transferase family 1 n=1 Tax=Bifidobacterium actinocoloniiforme DSM 22766 TaxID=1437605 RepID=A0A086Z1Z1_9BIFI|nr:glycosyltransferase [Bifidobacterium actinocoloniiforme]AKV55632.1 hypothetical protein AB656_04855 [Bifidobacterium actinocoloniiforme DSM 22766]KFI40541.1 glycosyl transferase family 1 [Bifidobacterium actinocoloniiforme DSM 22766]
MPTFFSLSRSAQERLNAFSPRLRALAESAMNYHSLLTPGAAIEYLFYMGQARQYPRLTDTSTVSGELTSDAGLHPFLKVRAISSSTGSLAQTGKLRQQSTSHAVRHILLTPDQATDADARAIARGSLPKRVYRICEEHAPISFDYVREALRHVAEHDMRKRIARIHEDSHPDSAHMQSSQVEANSHISAHDAKRQGAVVIAAHWLQPGGAERWAMETVRLVSQTGMVPIVITDNDSHQLWITRPELRSALVLCLSLPLTSGAEGMSLMDSLYGQFDIRAILIHHNQWMYDQLPRVKQRHPNTMVVDSLHILEYRHRGGYPCQAVRYDPYIDIHHVISPQLRDWLVRAQGIDAGKVVLAPLMGMTTGATRKEVKPKAEDNRLCVAFVGRVTRQKRPEVFIRISALLEHAQPGAFRFLMHGNGDLDDKVDQEITRAGLTSVVERRDISIPASQTYKEADVLLVTSDNEGLTLTTMEAISAGIPTLSATVGAQSTLIPKQGLLPRRSADLARAATRVLKHLLVDESDRASLWQAERGRLDEFARLTTANEYYETMLKHEASHSS